MTQVVVVGGGPVGLLLAGELRLGGADVVVLETRTEPTTESRASTLHARTMELLDGRDLVARLGSPPNELTGHFGGIPVSLAAPTGYPGQWKVLQATTARVLEDWAGGLGADIRRGYEVCALTDTGSGVDVVASGARGPVTVRADFVVACDGEQSTVRALVGAEFPGRPATRELFRADIAGIDIPGRRFHRLPRGFATAGRLPGGLTRVMVHEFGRPAAGGFSELVGMWARVVGDDLGAGKPVWVNNFTDAVRQLTSYRHGRILFAGDAAHQQPPIAGLALNLGLQDAANLGWKLAARVAGRAREELLDSYHDERHAVGARTLTAIQAQAEVLFGGREVEPLRTLLGELAAYPAVQGHLAALVGGLDVRYDLGDDHPLVGTRATCRLPNPGRGALLVSGDADHLRAAAAPWADRVDITELAAELATVPGSPSALLVRPDGHIAWLSGACGSLPGALRRWFGQENPVEPDSHQPRRPAMTGKTLTIPRRGHSRLLGVGAYRPRRSVSNAEICELIDSTEEWIETRSGITARGFAAWDETLPMMGAEAGAKALAHAGLTPDQVDHVIVTTCSNKVHVPALANAVADRLGAHGASGFDLGAGCAGFCHALASAADTIALGQADHVLVVSVERMRDVADPHDRGTSFLLADGAGAAVVGPSAEPGIGPAVRGSGGAIEALRMTSLWDDPPEPRPTLRMDGKRVFRWSMTDVLPAARKAIAAAGLRPADLAAFVPHQANLRMIEIMAAELGLAPDAVVARDVRDAGNTSSASVPLALSRVLDSGSVPSGAPVLLLGFGAGLAYCGQVVLAP
ncbi:beta-ketoacyl-ACP synthase 3 [Actinophytocola sediminis]